MGTSMVDRREMEAQLRRVEEEVRGRGREGGRKEGGGSELGCEVNSAPHSSNRLTSS